MTHATQVPNLCDLRAHAVHHDDGGGVPVHVSDDGRHGSQLCQFTGVFAAVSGNDFISTFFPWTDNRGDEYAIRLDAFCVSLMESSSLT